MLTKALEGVRSVGAVKRCQFAAGYGCEGPQPSRPPPIIVAKFEWLDLDRLVVNASPARTALKMSQLTNGGNLLPVT